MADTNEIKAPTNDAVPVQTPTTPAPVKVTKPAKKQDRSIEELHDASIKSMTDSEMRKYIQALRENHSLAVKQNEMLKHTVESAFEKCRMLEEENANIKVNARAREQFIRQAVGTLHQTVLLTAKEAI